MEQSDFMDSLKQSFYYWLEAIVRTTVVFIHNVYGIPAYCLWVLCLYPLRRVAPDLYWDIEGVLFKWLLGVLSGWIVTRKFIFLESGDDLKECYDEAALVLVNHQSTGDVPVLMCALQHKGSVTNRMLWLMDNWFQYTNFGAVSTLHGDFFVRSGKDVRDSELVRLKKHVSDVCIPRKRKWMVVFPEGGFLRKRKQLSQKYAEKQNLPRLEHLTLPRVGAVHTLITALHPDKFSPDLVQSSEIVVSEGVMDNLRNEVPYKWVIDVTLIYPNGEPLGLHDLALLPHPKPDDNPVIHLHYRKYHISQVPTELNSLTDWLFQRWYEKERLLDTFYTTGLLPPASNTPSPYNENGPTTPEHTADETQQNHVNCKTNGISPTPSQKSLDFNKTRLMEYSNHRLVAINCFFIASTAIQWWFIGKVWSSFTSIF